MVTERSVVAWDGREKKGKGEGITRRYEETFRDAGDILYLYYSNGFITTFITWDTLKTLC